MTCNMDCFNCVYEDCIKPSSFDLGHAVACKKYNETHKEQLQKYRREYYNTHKTQFKINKQHYLESLKDDPDKMKRAKQLKAERDRRYREKKRKERELCQLELNI